MKDTLPPYPSTAEGFCPLCRLPATFNAFCGREEESAALRDLLRAGRSRLITITGLGGSGKTRLAVECARNTATHFSGGVFFAPLADLREPKRIPEAIAAALNLPLSPAVPPLEQVAQALSTAPALLVLDNFEQIADGGGDIIQALLMAVPSLCCLVTSRHRLLVEAEREFPLAALPVPEHRGMPERLLEFASIQLFVDRAQAARPDFQFGPHNVDAVGAICAKLEGLPLAIELAAAWSQTLTPAQMLERLERRFDLLVTRRPNASPRHAALRTAIAWGFDLLPAHLKAFFTRLSIFQGGFLLEAAESVCEEPDAVVFLADLRDRSLLVMEEQTAILAPDAAAAGWSPAPQMRCRMLETLREFALEQLEQWPEQERTRLRSRHADYLLRLAEEAAPHLRGSREQRFRLGHLQTEHANLRAALEWTRARAAEHGTDSDLATHLRLCTALWPFWLLRGHLGEAERWLLRDEIMERATGARTDGEIPAIVLARALHARAEIAHALNEYDTSVAAMERALVLYREAGDRSGEGQALARLSRRRRGVEYAERRSMVRRARRLCRDAGDKGAEAEVLTDQAWLMRCQPQHYPRAHGVMARAVALYRAAGDDENVVSALREIGTWYAWSAQTDHARPVLAEALALARRQNNPREVGLLLWVSGYTAQLDDDLSSAVEMLREGAQVGQAIGDEWGLLLNLAQLGLSLLGLGDDEAAETAFRQSLPLARRTCERAGSTSLPELFIPFEGLAMSAARRGDLRRAARLFGITCALGRPDLDVTPQHDYPPAVRARYLAARAALRDAGGQILADWERGRALRPDQADRFALEDSPAR